MSEFIADLETLLESFTPVGLEEMIDALRGKNQLKARAFHLTFDDGFSEMSDVVAPILSRKGIPATFFINTAFLDNRAMCYLNLASLVADRLERGASAGDLCCVASLLCDCGIPADRALDGRGGSLCERREGLSRAVLSLRYDQRAVLDEIARALGIDVSAYLAEVHPYLDGSQVQSLLRQGFTIGAHSIDHPRYELLDLDEQVRQTVGSLREIRARFGLRYGAFAFPHSDRGVSRAFFDQVRRRSEIDLAFGTSGLRTDEVPWNIQRISLEKPLEPARDLIAFHLGRRVIRRLCGRELLHRS